jgi:SAM-dependent methyltransferase
MPLAVASHLISGLTVPSATVGDPMCGSGTTLVAAAELGRGFCGLDRDALAALIARCAVSYHDTAAIQQYGRQVLDGARRSVRRSGRVLPSFLASLPFEDAEFLRSWFPSRSLVELLALSRSIGSLRPGPARDALWVAFSGLIIAKSAGASFALDITRSRPHRVSTKPVVSPFEVWGDRLSRMANRLPFADRPVPAAGTVGHGDARAISWPNESVDLLLTSPPYKTAIDYLRAHKFSLIWMGHRLADLRELRGTMIGTERGLWERDGLPDTLERRLGTHVSEPAPRARLRRYLSDLRQVLAESSRVLRPGGLVVLAVGPTLFNLRRTDAAAVVGQLGEAVGLFPIANAIRPLRDLNRSLPPPAWSAKSASLAGRMRREIFVALRKPTQDRSDDGK